MCAKRTSVLLRHLATKGLQQDQSAAAIRCMSTAAKQQNVSRFAYKYFLPIQSRWKDNDQYGHVNNTVFYSYMDTIINQWLITKAGLETDGQVIGLCVSSQCNFHSSLEYPILVETGLRILKLGKSSVEYEVGIFGEGQADAAATGRFVHVFVDATSRRPTPIPLGMRQAMEDNLLVSK